MASKDGSDRTVRVAPIRAPRPSHRVYPQHLENEEDAPTALAPEPTEATVIKKHPGIEDQTTFPGAKLPGQAKSIAAPTIEDIRRSARAVEDGLIPDPTIEDLTEDFESVETARCIEPLQTQPPPRLMASERHAHRRAQRHRRSLMAAVFGMLLLSILAVVVASAFQPSRAIIMRTEHR